MHKQAWNNIIRKIEEELKPYLDNLEEDRELKVQTDSLSIKIEGNDAEVEILENSQIYRDLVEFDVDGLMHELCCVQCNMEFKLEEPLYRLVINDCRTVTNPKITRNFRLECDHRFFERYPVQYDQNDYVTGAILEAILMEEMYIHIGESRSFVRRRNYGWNYFLRIVNARRFFDRVPWLREYLMRGLDIPDELAFACEAKDIRYDGTMKVFLRATIKDADN